MQKHFLKLNSGCSLVETIHLSDKAIGYGAHYLGTPSRLWVDVW